MRLKHLGYARFLLRIKNRLLTSKYVARLKLKKVIKKRKRLHFFKYKNTIRVVNWLLKLRKLKSIKNPFKKPFRRFKTKTRNNNNSGGFKNKNLSKLSQINKYKQLSNKYNKNKGKGQKLDYIIDYSGKKPVINGLKKPKINVKRV